MTVGELLRRVSSRELSEWIAYYRVEPWGIEPADLRAGIISSTIANVNRDAKKKRRPYTPTDFIPKWGGKQPLEQTPEQQRQIIEQWMRVLGGSDGRQGGG